MKRKPIDVDFLSTRLKYVPETGDFVWIVSNRGNRRAGDRAGSINGQGYWRIKVGQVTYMAHRLAWAMYHGRDSGLEIDHIDGDPLNNKIDNLREATRLQNCRNIKGSGVKYDESRRRWTARITVNYKSYNLGRYHTEAEAIAAVNAARILHFGEFARVTR